MSLELLMKRMDRFEQFSAANRNNGAPFDLGNHQLVPVFEAIDNGLRRFLLAYSTGAGKTIIPIEVLKHLQRRGENPRALVIAPKQALLDNWDQQTLNGYGCKMNVHQILNPDDLIIPAQANFVAINYHKLVDSMIYVDALINYAKSCDLVIIDELHNVRNRNAKRAKGFFDIIEATKDKRLISLSATPIFDRIREAGMIAYSINPDRYQDYRTHGYDVKLDPETLWELRENGQIIFFDRDAVAKYYGLPTFEELEPLKVTMLPDFQKDYFEAFVDNFNLSKLQNMEKISIRAMIHSPEFQEVLLKYHENGYALNFFSHLTGKETDEDKELFSELAEVLRAIGLEKSESIHGSTPDYERKKIQEKMNSGNLDALINQWLCTGEAFSEVAGDRPVLIVPLRSPFSPGLYDQIIGRSYRPGQKAPVKYLEFHPHSDDLIQKIDDYVRDYAKQKGLRLKTTWDASLYHSDVYLIRKGKTEKISLLFTNNCFDFDEENSISSYRQYSHLLSRDRIIDSSERVKSSFGSGIRAVGKHIGTNYEQGLGLSNNAEHLGADYLNPEILLHTPGKINFFLAQTIEELKKQEKSQNESWKIADLGCCSSALFSQARIIYQTIEGLNNDIITDHIVSFDGNPGFVRTARNHLQEGEWTEAISEIRHPILSDQDMLAVQELVRESDYFKNLEFRTATFTKGDFGTEYDVIITSQCLQYNDQSGSRDIEKIVVNVNRSLKSGGHYLIVLSANLSASSSTSNQDFDSLKQILEYYGFKIESSEKVSGKKDKKGVLPPFYFINAVKTREAPGLLELDIIPIMYSREREVLTGGYKTESLRVRSSSKNTTVGVMPQEYKREVL